MEYDALGRLTSVCEITSGTGSGTCGQTSSQTGFWTKYTYDTLGHLLTVTQNAQSGTTQTRTFTYDASGRLTSEKNPEMVNTSGTQVATTYTYDTDATCGTHNGDLVKRVDPVGNVTCYAYDALHRVTDITYPSGSYASVTPARHFVYESATLDSVGMGNAKGRLAEAYTGPSTSKLTDLGFSYSPRGEVTDAYEWTPHTSSAPNGWLHTTGTYWENGLRKMLSGPGLPTAYNCPDGEGRVLSISTSSLCATTGYLASGTSYNVFSETTAVTFGSLDSDAFTYDPNTGRMNKYTHTVNGSSVIGNLTWNANGSLAKLVITDPFNSSNAQTCNYAYDDLARIASANCGTIWNETFSFSGGGQTTGAFGNLTKSAVSGAYNFNPTYSETSNRMTALGSQTPTYDTNGNLTSDGTGTGSNTFTYDAEGRLVSAQPGWSHAIAYDALGRWLEINWNGGFDTMAYAPTGAKMGVMTNNGGTLGQGWIPLSAGTQAQYCCGNAGVNAYWHPDWLGGARLQSSASRTVTGDGAYGPFGEVYAQSPNLYQDFTGANTDLSSSLYDMAFREYYPSEGRWITPDPGGLAAVDLANPQSLNRYAYVMNNPTTLIDPLGLQSPGDNCSGKTGASLADCVKGVYCTFFLGACGSTVLGGAWDPFGWLTTSDIVGGNNGEVVNFFNFDAPIFPSVGNPANKAPQYKKLTKQQCQALRTVLDREAKFGTPQAARMSSNTFGDKTLAPFNSSYVPNLQTPVGELDLDWYTDLQGWGLGFQPVVYPVMKTVWTVTRLFGGLSTGNVFPFQDPGERTALIESMDGGYKDIFTPAYMAQVCPK
jgi:RHS repeat-associated protein